MSASGRLVLIPVWLAEDAPLESVLPASVLAAVRGLRDFVVEDAKSARRFFAACAHPVPLRELTLTELNEHTPPADVPRLLEAARQGRDVGLLSEAGVPAVADPGARLVAAAHAEGIRVVPLAGPSSLLLALMASGLEGQRFRFVGYIPAQGEARLAAIAELERRSAADAETQILIETPYRNDALLADLLKACSPGTRLSVAAELTGAGEWIRMQTIERWRRELTTIGKRPAVFLLQAEGRPKRK